MALVAYDNSDSSDYDDEENEQSAVVLNTKQPDVKSSLKLPEPVQKQMIIPSQETLKSEESSLFKLLPQPSNKKPAFIEEDDEFLHKKEEANVAKPKAKITVPSLNDFKDVETSIPTSKPRLQTGKKSGLLSILPQPRNGITATTKSLIPNIITKKQEPKQLQDVPLKRTKINSAPLINDYSDDSDSEEVQNDFFSINKPVELLSDIEMPLDIEQKTNTQVPQKPKGIESFFKKNVDHAQLEPDYNMVEYESSVGSSHNGLEPENSSNSEVVLDEEAILKLCGARGKRKREEIHIVDVNQQEVLAEAREMLLKGIMDDTTKRVSASRKKGNEPTSQQKRKHQITYLAYQAKANEAELQNQWANNRMSKKQTQAKYGF